MKIYDTGANAVLAEPHDHVALRQAPGARRQDVLRANVAPEYAKQTADDSDENYTAKSAARNTVDGGDRVLAKRRRLEPRDTLFTW